MTEVWYGIFAVLALGLLVWGWRRHSRIQAKKARREAALNADDAQKEVLNMLSDFNKLGANVPRKQRLAAVRTGMDEGFGGGVPTPDQLGVRIEELEVAGVEAEWVLGPDADPNRRMLYLHGGAFFVGSRFSHRQLTAEFAKRTGLSVLVIDYRLMPENKRRDGIVDCQNAYRWILENGPGVEGSLDQIFIAGDSAGGNLTLMMTAWIRDQGLRQVDGAVALSPATDSTFKSPSMRANIHTDAMLGPGLGPLMRLPRPALLAGTAVAARMSPKNPLISPIHGDLSNLPPTLVHASECEMLLDDSRRYVEKAQKAGSPVQLQTWPDMVHVFQIFLGVLPQADEAFDRIEEFIAAQ